MVRPVSDQERSPAPQPADRPRSFLLGVLTKSQSDFPLSSLVTALVGTPLFHPQ
ncbi:hypothetical protein BDW69DRAFT_169416 [Aspergillus filifer]